MTIKLPGHAERFLSRLGDALRPIDARNRDAILLELRGHLQDCLARGAHRLDEALESMGEPEAFAVGFLAIGAPTPAGGALVSLAAEPANDPGLVAALRDTLAGARHGLWAVGLVLVCGLTVTNFALFQPLPPPGRAGVLVLRLVLVLAAQVAAYRLILRVPRPWQPDRDAVRYAAALIAAFAAGAGLLMGLRLVIAPLLPTAGRLALLAVAVAGWSLALLRLQPWFAALAVGRRDQRLLGVWRAMRGRTAKLAALWAAFVLPFFLVHFGLDVIARYRVADPAVRLGVAGD
jgi:hypothetical protein